MQVFLREMKQRRMKKHKKADKGPDDTSPIAPSATTAILAAKHRGEVVQDLHDKNNQQPYNKLCGSVLNLIRKMKKDQSQISNGRTG